MKAITFFSYKGGVGRTLAAANFAAYLAKLGLNVVIMDFDLEAPGVDSKFPAFTLPNGQQGLIDCILEFQRQGYCSFPVEEMYCKVPISSSRGDCSLSIIPAGDYLAPNYPAKLNELDWGFLFSERPGVAFFQGLLAQIEASLDPDVLVIDSRTGFSEIGGLCTQQLADETVILTSLASESIKMTRHLARIIRESEVSHQLGKQVDTKIVISRIPKPENIEALKAHCCDLFDIEEPKLFFLFSCPELEREEFVAMLDSSRDDDLVANYIQLFQGLDVQVAEKSIKAEIERTERGLLSVSPQEAEARIREMVALYPHPEVYRRAMRFFDLRSKPAEAVQFGLRLLDLLPQDMEALSHIAYYVLGDEFRFRRGFPRKVADLGDMRHLLVIAEKAKQLGLLTATHKLRLAMSFERLGIHVKSFAIATEILHTEELDDEEIRSEATDIAIRTAIALGYKEEANKLLNELPPSQLQETTAFAAIDFLVQEGQKEKAFEVVKSVLLMNHASPSVLTTGLRLGRELGRTAEVIRIIRSNPHIQHDLANTEFALEVRRAGFSLADLRDPALRSKKSP